MFSPLELVHGAAATPQAVVGVAACLLLLAAVLYLLTDTLRYWSIPELNVELNEGACNALRLRLRLLMRALLDAGSCTAPSLSPTP